MRRGFLMAALAFGLARLAAAHSPSPAEIVAALNAPETRTALGIQSAVRDARNPRVLIVRVDAQWFALDRADRLLQAQRWRDDWRHAVAQGVVGVLDGRTDLPVIDYTPGGAVFLRDAEHAERPTERRRMADPAGAASCNAGACTTGFVGAPHGSRCEPRR